MKSRRCNNSSQWTVVSGQWSVDSGQSPEWGFSLIELLMASVVVAVTGTFLVGALVSTNRSAERYGDRVVSTQLLASQLALLSEQISEQTPTSGAFPPPLDSTAWTLTWEETAVAPVVNTTLTVTHEGALVDVVTYRRLAQP